MKEILGTALMTFGIIVLLGSIVYKAFQIDFMDGFIVLGAICLIIGIILFTQDEVSK